jgi:hypothetical protein
MHGVESAKKRNQKKGVSKERAGKEGIHEDDAGQVH